ncbi:hypothetical protein FPCIR_11719 [Fusarium pseudocircinatum]|uniref:Uncharacterized protein n=1 Tax=Fusarium pseudocircinatum TaxID=56676 RepID=A0A8H5KQL1_9HYPO|nr:hypothetical protein FPCIR_11719 [Fusarium pseudocircinatum]
MKLSAILLLPLLHGAVSATNAVSSECTETHTLPIITTDLIPGATLEPYAPGYIPHPGNTNSNNAGPPKSSALPPVIPGSSGSGPSPGSGPAPGGSAPGYGTGSGAGAGSSGSAPGSASGSNATPVSSDHPQYASAASNRSAKIVGISAFMAGSIALVLQMTNF